MYRTCCSVDVRILTPALVTTVTHVFSHSSHPLTVRPGTPESAFWNMSSTVPYWKRDAEYLLDKIKL